MSIVAPSASPINGSRCGERVHKFVHFFLMRAEGGDVSLHDHEYDDVRWVSASAARRMLRTPPTARCLRAIDAARPAA